MYKRSLGKSRRCGLRIAVLSERRRNATDEVRVISHVQMMTRSRGFILRERTDGRAVAALLQGVSCPAAIGP